jgi:hypothetical protein
MTHKLNEFLVNLKTRAQCYFDLVFLHHRMGNTPKISQLFSARQVGKTDFDASPNDSKRSHVDFISGLGFQHVL